MLHHVGNVGHAIVRRLAEDPVNIKLPWWTGLVVLADLIIFFPLILFVTYTLNAIFPVLAIVEDPNPPAYEPVALDETVDQGPDALIPGKPVTSSVRSTRRLVVSISGWKSYFRGIACAATMAVPQLFIRQITTSWVPVFPIGVLVGQLALTQLGTAWVHIVISVPSEKRFYRRLPPFKKTFEATCFPILIYWLAETVSVSVPHLISKALGYGSLLTPHDPRGSRPPFEAGSIWKPLVVIIVALFMLFLVAIPAQVLLTRVQASLLPPDEDTVIPFDRSFGGKLDPAVVGSGFITMRDALSTFSRANWIRLYKLYAKITGVTLALYLVITAVVGSEIFLIISGSAEAPPPL